MQSEIQPLDAAVSSSKSANASRLNLDRLNCWHSRLWAEQGRHCVPGGRVVQHRRQQLHQSQRLHLPRGHVLPLHRPRGHAGGLRCNNSADCRCRSRIDCVATPSPQPLPPHPLHSWPWSITATLRGSSSASMTSRTGIRCCERCVRSATLEETRAQVSAPVTTGGGDCFGKFLPPVRGKYTTAVLTLCF